MKETAFSQKIQKERSKRKRFGIAAAGLLLIGLIAGCGQQKKADDVLTVVNNAKDTSIEQLIERAN